jgi:AcrR family transcriptional regulator
MTATTPRPTRREQRRASTVQEIKALAMEQISTGGPDAVSLSGIVREMSMSPAAIYRYFENRDALLGDLVVDAYNEFADFVVASAPDSAPATDRLTAVLNAVRTWALLHPNAYRLIFQTSVGSGQDLEAERTKSAATRSMAAIITALAAVSSQAASSQAASSLETQAAGQADPILPHSLDTAVAEWAERSGLSAFPPHVLALGLISWTRLHGIISLELGGHLAATGLDPSVLYDTEVAAIGTAVAARGRRTTPSA